MRIKEIESKAPCILKNFLIKQGVYDEFFDHLYEAQYEKRKNRDYNYFNNGIKWLVGGAFWWTDYPERDWQRIAYEWESFIDKKREK